MWKAALKYRGTDKYWWTTIGKLPLTQVLTWSQMTFRNMSSSSQSQWPWLAGKCKKVASTSSSLSQVKRVGGDLTLSLPITCERHSFFLAAQQALLGLDLWENVTMYGVCTESIDKSAALFVGSCPSSWFYIKLGSCRLDLADRFGTDRVSLV